MFDFTGLSEVERGCADVVPSSHEGTCEFFSGDLVRAFFKGTGAQYLATVDKDNGDGTYQITWEDEDDMDRRKTPDELFLVQRLHQSVGISAIETEAAHSKWQEFEQPAKQRSEAAGAFQDAVCEDVIDALRCAPQCAEDVSCDHIALQRASNELAKREAVEKQRCEAASTLQFAIGQDDTESLRSALRYAEEVGCDHTALERASNELAKREAAEKQRSEAAEAALQSAICTEEAGSDYEIMDRESDDLAKLEAATKQRGEAAASLRLAVTESHLEGLRIALRCAEEAGCCHADVQYAKEELAKREAAAQASASLESQGFNFDGTWYHYYGSFTLRQKNGVFHVTTSDENHHSEAKRFGSFLFWEVTSPDGKRVGKVRVWHGHGDVDVYFQFRGPRRNHRRAKWQPPVIARRQEKPQASHTGAGHDSMLSQAQGSAKVDGWHFTSAFDSGNALTTSWRQETDDSKRAFELIDDDVITFSVEIAADCYGTTHQIKGRPRVYWYHFGVTPPLRYHGKVRFIVQGMSSGNTTTYKPWVKLPNKLKWDRIADEAFGGKAEGAGFYIAWTHTFNGTKGTTHFAFCHPYGYLELMAWLDRLELVFAYARVQKERHARRRRRKACQSSLRAAFLRKFNLGPSEGISTSTSADEAFVTTHCYSSSSDDSDWDNLSWADPHVPSGGPERAGANVYFHRQTIARSHAGRDVDMLTITEDRHVFDANQVDQLPRSVAEALRTKGVEPASWPLEFSGRPVCFLSGRVHPGETSGQFATNGFLQFILSNDPRAAELRHRFVFKVVPMLNPDGVAWGHSRTNALGHDLNRCYRNPTPEQHEGVFAVKEILLAWAASGKLFFYMDCHGHGARRGCFIFGNSQMSQPWSSDEALLWNVAYVHAAQLNSPHIDIDACEWSRSAEVGQSGQEVEDDTMNESSRSDSGRAQIGVSCRLYHAYTLECNYQSGRIVRPVPDAPGLSAAAQATQATRGEVFDEDRKRTGWGKRPKPVPYTIQDWASVGEALAVALLDLHCLSSHSRLTVARPPPPLVQPDAEVAVVSKELSILFDALADRHRTTTASQEVSALGPQADISKATLRRRVFEVVHSPFVYIRRAPSTKAKTLGTFRTGDQVAVVEVRSDGWARLDPSEKVGGKRDQAASEAFILVDGQALQLKQLLKDTGTFRRVPLDASLHACRSASGQDVPPQLAPAIEDVVQGNYPLAL